MKSKIKNLFAATMFFAVSMTTYSFILPDSNSAVERNDNECVECRYDQCHAIAKSTGKRCRHCVSNYGDLYCYQH